MIGESFPNRTQKGFRFLRNVGDFAFFSPGSLEDFRLRCFAIDKLEAAATEEVT
jgi:hypothetical protein